ASVQLLGTTRTSNIVRGYPLGKQAVDQVADDRLFIAGGNYHRKTGFGCGCGITGPAAQAEQRDDPKIQTVYSQQKPAGSHQPKQNSSAHLVSLLLPAWPAFMMILSLRRGKGRNFFKRIQRIYRLDIFCRYKSVAEHEIDHI